MSLLHGLRTKMKYSSRVRKAAEEMFAYVRRGMSFEVPNGRGSDDLTTRAVLCLRELYPEQVDVVYQARGIIIGPVKRTMSKVSDDGWKNLDKGKYLPEAALAHNPERFIDDQHAWAAMQGLNRDAEADEGQRRQAERDRIVMTGASAVDAERSAVQKRQLTPEELIEQAAEAAMHREALEKEQKRRGVMAATGAPMPRGSTGPQAHAQFIDGVSPEQVKVEGNEVKLSPPAVGEQQATVIVTE